MSPRPPQPQQDVYTIAEAAAYARVSLWAIREAYRNGRLRTVSPGGDHRHPKVLHDDLMRWINGLPPADAEPMAVTG